MKFCSFAFVSLFALLLISGCNQPATETGNRTPTATPTTAATVADEFATARANFAKHCSDCHSVDGTGGLVTIDGKKLKVPSLKEGHAITHSDEKLAKQITDGDDEMPAFKDKLTPAEINDLVRLIRKEFQRK